MLKKLPYLQKIVKSTSGMENFCIWKNSNLLGPKIMEINREAGLIAHYIQKLTLRGYSDVL